MAVGQLIQFRNNTTGVAGPPYTLTGSDNATPPIIGEPIVEISAAETKLWVGDGTAPARLLFSTSAGDDTVALFSGRFLRLTGGSVTGQINTNQTTFTDQQLVTKLYVDTTVAAGNLFQGAWNAGTNTPTLPPTPLPPHGSYWIVDVAGTSPAGLAPGIPGGTQMNPGDQVIYNATAGTWMRVAAGGMTQTEADARYLQLTGGSMLDSPVGSTTPSVITMFTGYAPVAGSLQVATAAYVDAAISAGAWSNPAGPGVTFGRTPAGGWHEALAIDGGTLTGAVTGTALTLSGALTGTTASFSTPLPIGSGGTSAATGNAALDALSSAATAGLLTRDGAAAGSGAWTITTGATTLDLLSGASGADAGALTRSGGGAWALTTFANIISNIVVDPATMAGNGTTATPLRVVAISGGTF